MSSPSPWVSGKSGTALHFDGTDDRLRKIDPVGLTSSVGSIGFWMKADSAHNGTIFNFYERECVDFIRCKLNSDGRLDLYIEDDDVMKVNVSYDLDNLPGGYVGKWLHIMWVQSGSGVELYINGEKKVLTGTNSNWWSDHLTLTRCYFGYGWGYFNGTLDEVMVFNQAPSDSDILNRYLGRFICANWHFDEGTGVTAYDSSGNGNALTLLNMSSPSPWVDGKSGTALHFAGDNDFIRKLSPVGITSSVGAFEFWMKADSAHDGTIFNFYETEGVDFIRSMLHSDGRLDLYIEDNNVMKLSAYYDLDNLPGGYVGKWLHVMWVQDGYGVDLYINGE
jgi:hypothetical protein